MSDAHLDTADEYRLDSACARADHPLIVDPDHPDAPAECWCGEHREDRP